eukprot:gene5942-1060_t
MVHAYVKVPLPYAAGPSRVDRGGKFGMDLSKNKPPGDWNLDLQWEEDEKLPDMVTFTLQKEDHTIGNLIRMKLHEDHSVVFAGYRLRHPLEHNIEIKVQTDKTVSPNDAFKHALQGLASDVEKIGRAFKDE